MWLTDKAIIILKLPDGLNELRDALSLTTSSLGKPATSDVVVDELATNSGPITGLALLIAGDEGASEATKSGAGSALL